MIPHSRRNVLRAVGASGLGLAGVAGTASATCQPEPSGQRYEVQVFVTDALYEHCAQQYGDGFRARDRAETWIEGAFDQVNQEVTVLSTDEVIPAPAEIIRGSETVCVQNPCGSTTTCYPSVLQWWRDYACQLESPLAADSNVLLTAALSAAGNRLLSGGRAYRGGNMAVAYTGRAAADAGTTYSETVSAPNTGANGMHTVLHELGHTLQMTNGEAGAAHGNDGYDVHNVGGATTASGGFVPTTAVSPLADPTASTSECGCGVGDRDAFLMRWTGCSISYWGDAR
ncbi:hypothetical protein [Natronorubrum daqingense]|uniref:Uncharacterized protein n=1 Tax=Natronorubrum daqingense TaxID=588898 RepID=A0A1N7CIL4_9EURY|nr:hypothetical protein [Natronorubrum daqingense]APX96925.1 hypothetical protein BB347_09985 [Natronorubrum daqingense]SIR63429.1 hypothetical protein SAMN05421809_1725 [Natronorubrum daqingense]